VVHTSAFFGAAIHNLNADYFTSPRNFNKAWNEITIREESESETENKTST